MSDDPVERFAVGLAIAGLGLAALGAAGARVPLVLGPSVAQTGLHAGLAGLAALVLLLEGGARIRAVRAVGIALLALAALGALSPGLYGAGARLGLRLEYGEDLAHAALGAWGVWAARQATQEARA